MKDFLKDNIVILLLYLLALGTALYFIFTYQKNDIHIYLNHFVGNRAVNAFFYYITYLGDGRWAAPILFFILMYNTRIGIFATISFLSATLVSNGLKYFFFDDVNRPFFHFQYLQRYQLTFVEGVDLHIHNSFPSGHATQAFGIFMCLAFVVENKGVKFLLFVLALLTSLSRVYLSQHWLIDITAGSAIGMSFSILFYFILVKGNKFPKLDKPLFELRKK